MRMFTVQNLCADCPLLEHSVSWQGNETHFSPFFFWPFKIIDMHVVYIVKTFLWHLA